MRSDLTFAVAVASSMLLAGCVVSSNPDPVTAPLVTTLPGCDAERPAVAHLAGAVLTAAPGPAPIPCLHVLDGQTVEPTIGVDPATGDVFVYPIDPPGCCPGASVARSEDEGATWTYLEIEILGENTRHHTQDPYLYLDPGTGRLFVDDLQTINCSLLAWTDDGGQTWDHAAAGCMETDHQTIFAGPPAVGPTVGYPHVVYRCAANAVATNVASTMVTCQRSLDGGRIWLPPGTPAYHPQDTGTGTFGVPYLCDGMVGHGVVDREGTVYLPKGQCGEPWLAVSHDEGLTWTRTRVADLGMNFQSFVHGHKAGVAVDADGTVYYAWVATDRLPYVAVSHDGGQTFEEPRMVGAPGVNEATFPAIVAGASGNYAVLYMGTTNSPLDSFYYYDDVFWCAANPLACVDGILATPPDYSQTTWNAYVTATQNGSAREPVYWSASLNHPADPLVRGECGAFNCQELQEFLDLRLGPDGSAWASLVDDCRAACVSGAPDEDGNLANAGRLVGLDLSGST